MFGCLLFGKENLLDLANEGIDIYRSVKLNKIAREPSMDLIFLLFFCKLLLLITVIALLFWYCLHDLQIISAIIPLCDIIYRNFLYFFCLDFRNLIFFIGAHLIKILGRRTSCRMKKSIILNEEIERITKLNQQILAFLRKVDRLLNSHMSSIFLFLFIEIINLVT